MVLRSMKSLLVLAFSLFTILFSTSLLANDSTENHVAEPAAAHHEAKEGGFNVTETILEHIKDDHSWHLWGHTSIALPVILYTDKGIETFSSAKLVDEHHEPVVYKGANYSYKLFEGKLKVANEDGTLNEELSKKVWDFSITKNVASLFISVFVILAIFLTVGAAYKKRGVTFLPMPY